ncbi:hypothetical protein ACVIW2_002502 [Bradyrhizobium huanghuaihaiense]
MQPVVQNAAAGLPCLRYPELDRLSNRHIAARQQRN